MGLFDLLETEEPEVKEAEVIEKHAPAEDEKKEVEEVKSEPKSKKQTKKTKPGSYTYPFGIYSEGRLIDIDNYGFEGGKVYSSDEITNIMLQHRHYEFSGQMEYSFIKEDNVLVANAKHHRKG